MSRRSAPRWGLGSTPDRYRENASLDRHGWSADFATGIEDAHAGRLAADLLDVDPGGRFLAVLPMWAWLTPQITMGRKSHNLDKPLRFPVRITWDRPYVSMQDEGETAHFSVSGLGHEATGQAFLQPGQTTVPEMGASVRFVSPDSVSSNLRSIADRGLIAQWEVMEMLQAMLTGEVEKAHGALSADLGVPSLLDPISREQIVDTLLLGTDTKSSAAQRFIDRATYKPDTFAKVDPLRAARVELYRCARQEILLAVGDPREGRKVRAIADDFRDADGHLDLDGLICAYRSLHPADRLGRDRAVAALTAGPDIMAAALRDVEALLQVVPAA